ncbi:MAG: putative zinc-binding peptidase [Solirubrobacteraceae bacterium]|jgi:hypothetical protein
MRAFACDNCGQLLFFENSVCLRCGTPQGFVVDRLELAALSDADGSADGLRRCANAAVATCNWMLASDDVEALCRSCRLTRTRPNDSDAQALAAFAEAESAKRRLLFQLLDVGLPVQANGPRFDLLSSAFEPVSTGHEDGLITIDLAESDDVRREQRRAELGEPYRTMLGHFRHEVAHYYWPLLVEQVEGATLERFRSLFGDEREDYAAAQERHYSDGPRADWAQAHVSAYATMHPWEDWAETFAHYLHIRDTLQTAAAFGLLVAGPQPVDDPTLTSVPEIDAVGEPIESLIESWLPLTYALNAVNRSMGLGDLYPFTLAPAVIEKLGYVHERVLGGQGSQAMARARL